MIKYTGKRLAAGLWKVLAGIALILLLLTQQARVPETSDATTPQAETGAEEQQ